MIKKKNFKIIDEEIYEIYECSDIVEQIDYYGYKKSFKEAKKFAERIIKFWSKRNYKSNLIIINGVFCPSNVIKAYSNK